jgi:chromosome segregation ATPase
MEDTTRKLEEEIQKLREERSSLRKVLLKERGDFAVLKERVEELQYETRKKAEELDALTFSHTQLTKRCQNLQEMLRQKEQQNQGWSLWGKRPGNEVEKLQEALNALEEDLKVKIEENEHVHVENFERTQKYKQMKRELREAISKKQEEVEFMLKKSRDLEERNQNLQNDMQGLNEQLHDLKVFLEEKRSEVVRLKEFMQECDQKHNHEKEALKQKISIKVSLDNEGYEFLDSQNAPQFKLALHQKQQEIAVKTKRSLQSLRPVLNRLIDSMKTRMEFLQPSNKPAYDRILQHIHSKLDNLWTEFDSFINELSKEELLSLSLYHQFKRVQNSYSNFCSSLALYLDYELKFASDSHELQSVNSEIIFTNSCINLTLSRILSFIEIASIHESLSWSSIQELVKKLSSHFNEIFKIWSKRLAMDTRIRYNVPVKSTRSINDAIQSSLSEFSSTFGQAVSTFLQLRGSWYYFYNRRYKNTVLYLQRLRDAKYQPGIPYDQAHSNLEKLKGTEVIVDEQRLEILSLQKDIEVSRKETQKVKEQVIQLENECAALEQNLSRGETETGPSLVKEPEVLSEDVRNGAQRLAVRLIDSLGEAVPVSQLTIERDLIEKMKKTAEERIREMADEAFRAECNLSVVTKALEALEKQLVSSRKETQVLKDQAALLENENTSLKRSVT